MGEEPFQVPGPSKFTIEPRPRSLSCGEGPFVAVNASRDRGAFSRLCENAASPPQRACGKPGLNEVGMLKKLLLALCIGALSSGAVAAESGAPPVTGATVTPAAEKMVRQAVKNLAANVQIDSIETAPIPGFYQVIAAGQMIYVSTDGKYLMHGDVIDLTRHENVSDAAWSRFRKDELAKVPASQRIVFAPPHPKYTISVFTDVNCGFCRALHEHVAAFNKEGIAVEYLAWPREGLTTTAGRPTPTYTEMVSVWCASDRKAAFTAAKEGHAPAPATCVNPVKDQFNLGLKLGVSGTPMIIGPDGSTLGGYVTPEQLLQALQKGS
jgi:thiol:disulfide interchange protein DsbC